jgi:hypothetical protein
LSFNDLVGIAKKCGPTLQELKVDDFAALDEATAIRIIEHCNALEKIEWPCTNCLTDALLMKLADDCPNLSSLSMTIDSNVSAASILRIASSCNKLRHFNCIGQEDHRVTSESIIELLRSCGNLETLSLQFDPPSIDDVPDGK